MICTTRFRSFATALLLAGALTACSDAPTASAPDSPLAIPGANGPALNTAPSITSVTNSGGYPLISWNAVPGAISYTVHLITFTTLDGQYLNHWFAPLTTTTATSYLDTDNPWTGAYACSSGYYNELERGEVGHWYEYSVQANFSSGSSDPYHARHYASIAPSSCG